MPSLRQLASLVFISGFAALCLEMVWLRKLALSTGSAGFSAIATLSLYMGGLGIGGWLGGRYVWKRGVLAYGAMEVGVAVWALSFPALSILFSNLVHIEGLLGVMIASAPLLLPPAILHGATLPALCSVLDNKQAAGRLYAANTFGAVMGTLMSAFVLMPELGVRGTEITGALIGLLAAAGTWRFRKIRSIQDTPSKMDTLPGKGILFGAFIAGGSAMGLEIIWSRLGALLIGGSVYAFAVVLAVFLAGIAFGADWGRRLNVSALRPALALTGLLAITGGMLYGVLPHGLALFWDMGVTPLWSGGLLLALAMAGAPIASGVVFSLSIKAMRGNTQQAAGKVLAANAMGCIVGVIGVGAYGLPTLGIFGVLTLIAALCCLTATTLNLPEQPYWKRGFGVILLGVLVFIRPPWDPATYAVGLYNRIGEFVDFSPRAVDRFIHEGWDLAYYQDGQTASVAIGKSRKSNNIWLSINGKVDASSGADMPTQILSGQLPLAVAKHIVDPTALVIGLASGVTLGETLSAGASKVTVIELEPAVVEASYFFNEINGDPLNDSRTTLIVDDARAVLSRYATTYNVIISEPSNPWLTGISNLFTREYWALGRKRLKSNGVFCQWVQLYALSPEAFRSLIATYISVFPNTWLFETIPGSDALLISSPELPEILPIEAVLGPSELKALSEGARINTDNNPWIEFEAPKWIHKKTGQKNQRLIDEFKP